MGKRSRSFLSALALGSAVLFFGPAASKANASPRWHAGPFHRHSFVARGFVRHPFVRRPFRTVRVFVYAPFPHWVFRRVYFAPPFACAPF